MNTQLFITKVAVPIIEAWDFPAMIFENGEPFVINDAMYRLLSWSDAHDSHITAKPPEGENSRLCALVHRHHDAPRAVLSKSAVYPLNGSGWVIAVCDNSPEQLMRLLLASMSAHIEFFHSGDLRLTLTPAPEKNWTVDMPGNMQGYDARVLSEWRSLRGIYAIYDGEWRHVCKTPLRDANMRVAGVVSVYEPITGSEPELVRVTGERMALENIVGHSSCVLFSCRNEEDFPLEYISDNINRYLVPDDIPLGRGVLADLIDPDERGGLFYEINKNYGSFADFSYEHSITLRGGEKRYMKTVMHFVTDRSGQIVCLEGQMTAISEHRAASVMLDELKRPLQDILGYDLMENISPIGNEISLYDVVDINEALGQFAKTFGVGSAIVDLAGVPITKPISYSPAGETCGFINLACEQDVCRECYQRIAKMLALSGHNEVLHCKATGLMMTASPVRIGERIVAAWVLCQMLTGDDYGRFLLQTGKQHGIDASSFEKMLADVPRYSIAKFESARSILDLVANQVSMLATRSAQFFVQEDIAGQERGHKNRLTEHEALMFNCFSNQEALDSGSPLELLEEIAVKLKFNRAYYYQAGATYSLRYEWFDKTRLPRELRMPPLSIFPEYTSQTLEVYEASRITEQSTNRYAELSGARCMVHLPVFSSGRLLGVLGLDECTGVRIFFGEDKKLLSSLLGTVAAMLKKKECERNIEAIGRCAADVRRINM